jgi:hypothetical protein
MERDVEQEMTEVYDKIKGQAVTQTDAEPRPDVSAGLIEAAEWHEARMKTFTEMKVDSAALHHDLSARYFRARAADRSGK